MHAAMPAHIGPPEVIMPVVIALVIILLISLLREPARQRFSAVFVAGAGAAYFSGGLGGLELAFCGVITLLAFAGLSDYRAIGVAWLLHSGWDLAHVYHGNPILPFARNSSFGCFVCDPVLALWYLLRAPDLLRSSSGKLDGNETGRRP